MKRFLTLIFIVSITGCSNSDIESENSNSFLSKVEFFFENENPWRTIEILANENDQVSSISDDISEVSTLTYQINLERSILKTNYKFVPDPNNTEWTKTYEIQHIENDILVKETESGEEMIFSTSNNYVVEYKLFIENQSSPYNRIVFRRNESNQIESIESFTTEGQSVGVEIPLWKLTFSNHYSDNKIPSFSNPVIGYGLYNFYDFTLSELLELKISSASPLNSEVSIDNNIVDNINVQIVTTTINNMPMVLKYNYGFSDSDYKIRYNY